MTLTVTGVETIEITDPKGLIEIQSRREKLKLPQSDPLDELLKPRPFGPKPSPKPQPTIPAPFTPFPGRPTSPNVGPYTTGPLINPIPLPGHVPGKATPLAIWRQFDSGRWSRGLRATFGQENTTGQVF